MGKSLSSVETVVVPTFVGKLTEKAMLAQGQQIAWTDGSSDLSQDDLKLTRPVWASFQMESAYWDSLRQICVSADITESSFITEAKRKSPSLPIATAVQMQILEYVRRPTGGVSTRPLIQKGSVERQSAAVPRSRYN